MKKLKSIIIVGLLFTLLGGSVRLPGTNFNVVIQNVEHDLK